jgi:hypothetical protein
LTRAADKDRLEFQRRIQLGEYLTDLKKGIDSGRIERIAWLDRVTKQLDGIEFPDAALKKLAGDIVTAADARKKALAASYRQEVKLVPALQAQYDAYDPGWSRW